MKKIIRKYLILLLSIYILQRLTYSLILPENLIDFVYTLIMLLIITEILKPIINLVFIPINLLTFNTFKWIINISVFYLWVLLTSNVRITPWQFTGLNVGPVVISGINFSYWQTIIILGILFNLIFMFIKWVFFIR